ncbi:MAG: isoprenylcysteine carboxylmethyltransferase family protein [Candidatus Acidiferrum sp.]
MENLLHGELTPERALNLAKWCWLVLAFVWIAMAFAIKRAKRRESIVERLQYTGLLVAGFLLLFGEQSGNFRWLQTRLLPGVPGVWWAGLLLTAVGVAIAILARFSLGSNWSGTVTLKEDHELVRKGLYSRIRHPIYTGILLGAIGSGMIQGELRDLLGFLVLLTSFFIKAKREESFLFEEFGTKFTEHQRHTGMFLPKQR